MMPKIIAHRSNLNGPKGAASSDDVVDALTAGFGVELDFREYEKQLVISHDRPTTMPQLTGEHALTMIADLSDDVISALNVKDEASLPELLSLCERLQLSDKSFAFDFELSLSKEKAEFWMKEFSQNLNVARRISQTENFSEEAAQGKNAVFWLDCWDGTIWYSEKLVSEIHALDATVYAVSPELHKAEISAEQLKKDWLCLLDIGIDGICTDYPFMLKEAVIERRTND